MPKYIETQTRKLISSYGGVGSIIETKHGALMVKPFDEWRYFRDMQDGSMDVEVREIDDKRLLNRLKYNFKKLDRLIAIPINSPHIGNSSIPQDKSEVAKATYYPKWMYCSKCNRFKHIDDWFAGWRQHTNGSPKQKRDSFVPPKCCFCYSENKGKSRRFLYPLEQVRFIMTSPDGKIEDFPWERWTIAEKYQSEHKLEEDEPSRIDLKWDEPLCCDHQDLRYKTSRDFSDFVGIIIYCANKSCKHYKKIVNLSGLFGLRKYAGKYIDETGNPKNYNFKPVIRTSNSVYYPLITSSIYLPLGSSEELNTIQKQMVNLLVENGHPIELIASMTKFPIELIHAYLNPVQEFITEEQYRLMEYQFLNEKDTYHDDDLSYEYINADNLIELGISKLISLRRLKMTSVQTGYTRQEPLDNDDFAKEGNKFQIINDTPIKARYTSNQGINTTYLPATESYGEGIFIDLSQSKLDKWFDNFYGINESFTKRLDTICDNINQSDFAQRKFASHIASPQQLAKFTVIHTLSHLLIKELEFLVGYPATSLQERLYVNDTAMQRIMIYTISGAEGSYGGLLSQATENKFSRILKSALARAKDCSSDPVCYNTTDGQGIGGLNFAACYSCALLPETSCEEFNSVLDRAFLIDSVFGYFSTKN